MRRAAVALLVSSPSDILPNACPHHLRLASPTGNAVYPHSRQHVPRGGPAQSAPFRSTVERQANANRLLRTSYRYDRSLYSDESASTGTHSTALRARQSGRNSQECKKDYIETRTSDHISPARHFTDTSQHRSETAGAASPSRSTHRQRTERPANAVTCPELVHHVPVCTARPTSLPRAHHKQPSPDAAAGSSRESRAPPGTVAQSPH